MVYLSTGSVDLRYRLGLITHKYQLTHRNLADGFPHYINITRHNRTIKTQVRALTVVTINEIGEVRITCSKNVRKQR